MSFVPITHKRHIPYQMLIARNAKIHGLYITLLVVICCSGVDLTIDANFQSAIASQLRRHVHDVVMAGDCPSVLLASEHVIPVLIEHKISPFLGVEREAKVCYKTANNKGER